MDLDGILNAVMQFFATDVGRMIGQFLTAIYKFLYPANAEGMPIE